MIVKKIFYLFIILFFPIIFSTTFITEINFGGDEFIEIYDDGNLNFSEAIFFDERKDKNQSLVLIKNSTSNFVLITSNNFLSSKNISNLNYTIYSNSKNSLGYYGLKNSGENITIFFNDSFNLKYKKNSDLSFLENQSLNFNTTNFNYFIDNFSLNGFNLNQNFSNYLKYLNCKNLSFNINLLKDFNLPFTEKIEYDFSTNLENNFTIEYWIDYFNGKNIKSKYNSTNINKKTFSKINSTNLFLIKANLYYKNCKLYDEKLAPFYVEVLQEQENKTQNDTCNYDLEIETKKYISIEKIQYRIKTNSKNFSMIYWIEDFSGNIIKKKLNSTNDNYRTYTPKYTNIFNIKAELYTNDSCYKNVSKYQSFFSENEIDSSTTKIKKIYVDKNNVEKENESHIKLIDENKSYIEIEIYRGNTRKYTINFYLENKLFQKFNVEKKFTKAKIKIDKKFFSNFSKIKIEGLGLEKELIFNEKKKKFVFESLTEKNEIYNENVIEETQLIGGKIIAKSKEEVLKEKSIFIFSIILVILISLMIIKW